MKGAEAVLSKSKFNGNICLIKERIPKNYRVKELDNKLRKTRTKQEIKLLKRLTQEGIPCPRVLDYSEYSITMSIISGKHPEENSKNLKKIAELLAKIHSNDIIHGDFTLANLILSKGKIYVIDFGLGFFSRKVEDKAMDVFTMLLSIHNKKLKNTFLESYLKHCTNAAEIEIRLSRISKRVRYS